MDFIDTPWPVRHASDPSDDIDLKDFIDNLGDDGDGFLDNTGARLEASAGASVAQGSPRSIFGMRASSLEELMAEAGRIAPPGGVNGAGARAAADLERVARAAGLHGLCDALAFTGLAAELPALCEAGVTVLAPSDAAWAQIEPRSRADPVLIRQVLLAHICSGVHMRSDLVAKRTAVALAGQPRRGRELATQSCLQTSAERARNLAAFDRTPPLLSLHSYPLNSRGALKTLRKPRLPPP